MALPKLTVMKHELSLPSTGEKISYRPFLVKEEKILMMALQSENPADMIRALKQIIMNCVENDIKIDDLPPFDIEYIFLQLRARSIGETIPISYTLPDEKCTADNDCEFEIEINIDDIKIEINKEHKELIELTDSIKLKMKYPDIETSGMMTGVEGTEMVDKTFDLIGQCIEYILDGEEMHKLSDYTKKESQEFLDSLSTQHFKEIQTFFDTMPNLKHEITAVCKTKRTVEFLKGWEIFSYRSES